MSLEKESEDPRLTAISACFTVHQDFPKKGVSFRNILPVLRDPKLFKLLNDVSVERIHAKFPGKIDLVAGLEARGFLFGPSLADRLGCGFVPIRKPGKLPGKLVSVDYEKEYGKDVLEVEEDAIKPGSRVLLVDDVLATGGSLAAAAELVRKCGGTLVGSFVVVEMAFLNGRKKAPDALEALFIYT
ncbi:putative Adenine phosphoribosyltransferase [Hypsibius exemplaris]|uniref:Adenine phosphoribosyltransferase n=1 Tax=Hypsibius exemplaris TaxID=2072580 RepID=A0A1W0WMY1_HYPEX|nr:putative Adenine phosphoribosyltransferase [Hypsibius exemplaris]